MKSYIGQGPKEASFLMEPGGQHSGTWNHLGSPIWNLPKPPTCGFLWRFHYISMTDELIVRW